MGQSAGQVHIYGNRKDGKLIGAEHVAPSGEHMAHLIAWALQSGLDAREILAMPFYHPVLEEALITGFRGLAEKVVVEKPEFELLRCQDAVTG